MALSRRRGSDRGSFVAGLRSRDATRGSHRCFKVQARMTVAEPQTLSRELFPLLKQRLSPAAVLRQHEPLSKRTTLRVGGPADLYVEPADETDLARVLQFCRTHKIPWMMLGRGSNLLVRDGGIRGVVICLAAP